MDSMSKLGETWNKLHAEHGKNAVDGGVSGGNDAAYLYHGSVLVKKIHDIAGVAAQKNVLDYGCGDARLAVTQVKMCANLSLADGSQEILKKADARLPGIESFNVTSPSGLPADRTWDCIYAVAVIYHLTDIQVYRMLLEMKDHLNPNGVFVFDLCNFYHPEYIELLRQKATVGDWSEPWPWVPQSATNITHFAMQVAGYRAVQRFDSDTSHVWLAVWK
jgi:trans-aconitate methyltransferase